MAVLEVGSSALTVTVADTAVTVNGLIHSPFSSSMINSVLKNIKLRAERQLGYYLLDGQDWAICNVGGNRSPGGNLHCQRESPSLSHEERV
jgi:hypothetical protein